MKILYCGDVVGKSGREVIKNNLANLKTELSVDMVMVNGENSAHGFGINSSIAKDLFSYGADVITLGNHSFDNKEVLDYLNKEPNIIRPLNVTPFSSGKGFCVFTLKNGLQVLVLQVLGQLFMPKTSNHITPFSAIDKVLEYYKLRQNVSAIILDVHAEATSEKASIGFYVDGKVSAVLGTHSHVPTNDCRILEHGTAFQSDVGMCGDYNSVIGMKKEAAIGRFLNSDKKKLEPAEGEGTLFATLIEIDDNTGLALSIKPIRAGLLF